MRDYKKLIRVAKEENAPIVVTREELMRIRKEYDNKYTIHINRLQNGDLTQGRALLQGVKLSWGEWDIHQGKRL